MLAQKRSRGWVFTLFKYTDEDINRLQQLGEQVQYIRFGKELTLEKQKPHLQGFIYFHNAKSGVSAQRWIDGPVKPARKPHVETARGTIAQNKAYTSKEGEWFEAGEAPTQGDRTDMKKIKKMVQDGASMKEVIDVCTNYQALRGAELLMKYQQPPPDRPNLKVYWWWGPSGCSKSYCAKRAAREDASWWISSPTGGYFQGYCGQKSVVLDDWRPHLCKFSELLRIIDVGPVQVPVKGSSHWWIPEQIWITAPKHPKAFYGDRTDEEVFQLLRRITEIRHFTEVYTAVVKMPTEVEGRPASPPPKAEAKQCNTEVAQKSGVILAPTSVPIAEPSQPKGFAEWSKDHESTRGVRKAIPKRLYNEAEYTKKYNEVNHK